MLDTNHYQTLKVSPNASQAEIKQAYRRLVKQYHPDINQETANHEYIIRINAAYEVLGDTKSRQIYDHQLHNQRLQTTNGNRQQRSATAGQQYQATRHTGRDLDEQIEEWLHLVYQPVNRLLREILNSLAIQIEKLAADPFDDELLEQFQEYLNTCRDGFKQAQTTFRSLPNPPSLARAAAHLYYCLNQIGDGLDELEYFPLNYDESYLHAGQEMFRIAKGLYWEAQDSLGVYA
ncbi:DnaJ domain-containing protein [Chlorogloeopsis sp. ULAP01]|uniref:J domain-containing protein n=1 Tax=Chlorogloeopsis sp. ULAP01 TaxID=3056483 RepID=UPI0025AB43EB|nr:J domain-containing protein [Chlorogloeopsis sp. ULAP01]MDM9380243.1 DnaJ domain-containing protein [Chlorogloeopsis sp. ULAP01]